MSAEEETTGRGGGGLVGRNNNNIVHEKTEEPEGENSDLTSDDNNSTGGGGGGGGGGGNGAGPKMKKRPRDGGGGGALHARYDHMNDSSFSAPKKESSSPSSAEQGKEGDGGGRTCVSCRTSKVKCSKGSPCKRCNRLKLKCVAQVRGRGRPVASGGGGAAKKGAKPEGKGGGNGGSAVGGGRDGSYPSGGGGSFLARGGSGALPSSVVVLSSTPSGLRAGSEGVATVGSGSGNGSGSLGASSVDARVSFGFPSSTVGAAPPITATGMSCPPALGFNGPIGRGSTVSVDGGGGGGGGYGHQDFDPSSRPFPSHLLSTGRPLPPAAAQHQGAPQGSFPAAARTGTYLFHGGGGGSGGGSGGSGSGASDGAPGRMANAPGLPPMTGTAGRGSINSGGSWRAVFHGEDPGTAGSRANKGSSSLSSDGGFGGFNGKDLTWAETMDEHKDAVAAAAAAAADGEEFLSRSTDDKARWLMDVEHYTGASGVDSEERSPEAGEGDADPTDTIVTGFWKLFSEREVHRPKAVLVIRHWALCALERRSTRLMRKTVNMARALCINVAEILNDYGIYAMFHELLREAEAGNTIEPARPVKLGHQEAPPYIREMLSSFAAVSTRVVLRGQSTFFHNEMCTSLFLSTEQANELYASNTQDVWATIIHPDDHNAFFDSISIELFRAPGHKSEFTKICKCREQTGTVFLALVHFRYEFQDEGNYAAYGLSMLPLPESGYLQKVEQPPTLESGHEGAGAAAAAAGSGAGVTPMATAAARLCDASLPLPGSSVRSSVTSTASSLSGVGPSAGGAGGARRGSGDLGSGGGGGGAGGGGDFYPLRRLDAMHQRVASFPPPGRPAVDAWASHDMGGAVSAGDIGRGLDDSLNSSRASVNGGGGGGGSGGGGEGFQDGIGGGRLELDSGRGGLSSGGWVRAPSRGEIGIADGL